MLGAGMYGVGGLTLFASESRLQIREEDLK